MYLHCTYIVLYAQHVYFNDLFNEVPAKQYHVYQPVISGHPWKINVLMLGQFVRTEITASSVRFEHPDMWISCNTATKFI